MRTRPTAQQWAEHYEHMVQDSIAGKSMYKLKSKSADREKPKESIKEVTQTAATLERARDQIAAKDATLRKKKKSYRKSRRSVTDEDDIFS